MISTRLWSDSRGAKSPNGGASPVIICEVYAVGLGIDQIRLLAFGGVELASGGLMAVTEDITDAVAAAARIAVADLGRHLWLMGHGASEKGAQR